MIILEEKYEDPQPIEIHKKAISRIKFSPCGNMVATCCMFVLSHNYK